MKNRYFALLVAAVMAFSLMAIGCGEDQPEASGSSDTPTSTTTDSNATTGGDNVTDPSGEATDPSGGTTSSDVTTSGDKVTLAPGDIFGSTTKQPDKTTNKTTSKTKVTQKTNLTSYEEKMYKLAKDYLGKDLIDTKKVNGQTIQILSHTAFDQNDVLLNAFNVTIEYTQVDNALTRFITRVESGDSPDLFWNDVNSALIAKGYVQAWDKYIDFSDPMYKEIMPNLDRYKMGGRHYFVHSGGGKQQLLLFHTAPFKEIGEKNPYELMQEGKWDWNALKRLCKKLNKDTNNDGIMDQIAYAQISGNSFSYASGSDMIDFVDGKPVNRLSEPHIARAYAMQAEMKNEYHMTGWYSNIVSDFDSGKIVMAVWERAGMFGNFMDEFDAGTMGFCAPPKDPDADKHYVAQETPGFYLAKGAKHPEAAAAWMMVNRWATWDKEAQKLTRQIAQRDGNGYSDKYWEVTDFVDANTTGVQLTWAWMNVSDQLIELDSRSSKGESWAKLVAEISPKLDAQIKNFEKNLG